MKVGYAALALVLLVPEAAFAWGPVTHLWHGATVLGDLSNVPPELRQLLDAERWAYLYGIIAADIVQAKRYARSIYDHCHSWRVGWRVLGTAATSEERAFAWGYLSHLAADVWSHNHFVPAQMITSFPSRWRRHVYWEVRFDAQFNVEDRRLLEQVHQHRSPRCEALIERVVDHTLFSFGTNRRIFRSMVALQHYERWQVALGRLTARSRFELPPREIERYKGLCVDSIRDLLRHGEQSFALEQDPNGHENLRRAKEIRRKMRALERRGVSRQELRKRAAAAIAEAGLGRRRAETPSPGSQEA